MDDRNEIIEILEWIADNWAGILLFLYAMATLLTI